MYLDVALIMIIGQLNSTHKYRIENSRKHEYAR